VETSISKQSRQELTDAIRKRYAGASKQGKSKILDEFVSLTGYHRKHAIRLLTSQEKESTTGARPCGQRIYDEAVKEVLIIIWEASDRICGKRLEPSCRSLLSRWRKMVILILILKSEAAFLK
jgi:hypothetical protein